jgi:nucleotide-binding universal stress UspA family protein
MLVESGGSEQPNRIVVGVDGSDHSKVALAWAAREATMTGAPLTVVTTWEFPTNYGYLVPWPEDLDFAAEAKNVLVETVAEVLGETPTIEPTLEVVRGHAALVLEDLSRSSGLLVVGSRGHGEFTGMLLGSVSEFLATHAHCPLVIIRGDGEQPATA